MEIERIERIELKLLQCLIALVEERSVTRAAQRLGLSQPRMSNSLRRLRELSADPLLVRVGQRLVPTDRALVIAARVQNGLQDIACALSNQRTFDADTSDRAFTVMMSGYTAVMLLPEVLRRIRAIAPAMQILNLPMSHANLHRLLEDGTCDLAFGYLRGLNANLRMSNCFADTAVCIASVEHWGTRDALTLEDFIGAHHVSMGESPNSTSTIEVVLDRNLHMLERRRRIAARSPTPSAVAHIVAATDLLAVLSERLASDYVQKLPLRIFPLPVALPSFHVTMVWHERSHHDAGHAWIRDQFRRAAAKMPGSMELVI